MFSPKEEPYSPVASPSRLNGPFLGADVTALPQTHFPSRGSVSGLLILPLCVAAPVPRSGGKLPYRLLLGDFFLHICLSVYCSFFFPALSLWHRVLH